MAKRYAVLQGIEHNGEISQASHKEFLCHLQKAILLALREQGRINVMQHRHAEEKLKQHQKPGSCIQKEGGRT